MSFKDTEIGKIPLDWEIAELGELADVLSGYAFKGKDFVDYGIPVIKIKNIVPPYVSIDDVQYVSEQIFNESKKYQLKYNDILISMTGSNYNQMSSAVGKVGKIRLNNTPMLLNQRVGKIIPNENLCNKEFIYYNISTMETRYRLALSAGGSANQANISPKQIKSLKIPIPPIEEQKAIAHILSTLDEKIEVNNQINKTLENMAQAIFKQWFVDFEFPNEDGEPYKSSGGEMVESELGMIPKGWEVKGLDEIADYLNGLAMQKFRPEENEKEYPVLKIKELRQGFTDSSSDVCSVNIDKKYIIHDGDIIFSWSGSLLVDIWCGGTCGLNQHLFKVTSKEHDKWFYYHWTEYHLKRFVEIAASKATTMGHIKRKDLSDSKVAIPSKQTYDKASRVFKPLFDKIIGTKIESKRLTEIRDALLPRLMSGEIRVPLDEEGEVS